MAKIGKKLDTKILALETNARQTLEFLLGQFEVPEFCYRELVQNALDSESPRIDVRFDFKPDEKDENKGKFVIGVEDYGMGMTQQEQEEYLTRLFASSKEGDSRKIGRFGIGFVSVFTLQPDYVIVESSKNEDNWKLVIEKDFSSKLFENKERKGTKVEVVFNEIEKNEAIKMEMRAHQIIRQQCRFCKTPIYVGNKEINVPFDIEAPAKIQFKDILNGIEGVLALTEKPSYILLNNRLGIKEREDTFLSEEKNISALISSRDLRYNLSRNDVVQDESFEKIQHLAYSSKQKLYEEVFRVLEKKASEKHEFAQPSDARHYVKPDPVQERVKEKELLWEHAAEGFKREVANHEKRVKKKGIAKAVSSVMMNSKIFTAYDLNDTSPVATKNLSLQDLLQESGREIYYSGTRTMIVDILLRQGKNVIVQDKYSKEFLEIIEKDIGKQGKDADYTFYVPRIVFEDQLSDDEKAFIKLIVQGINEASLRKNYKGVLLSENHYVDGSAISFVNESSLNSLAYKENESLGGGFLKESKHILLHRSSPSIIQLMRLSKIKPELTKYLALRLITTYDHGNGKNYSKELYEMYSAKAEQTQELQFGNLEEKVEMGVQE